MGNRERGGIADPGRCFRSAKADLLLVEQRGAAELSLPIPHSLFPLFLLRASDPAKTDPLEVAAILIVTLLLTFPATFFPARKAASTDPVQVLRYE
jgi:hypothetical protein